MKTILLLFALLFGDGQEIYQTYFGWGACQYAEDWYTQHMLRHNIPAWNNFMIGTIAQGRCVLTIQGEAVRIFEAPIELMQQGAVIAVAVYGNQTPYFLYRGALYR